MGTHNVHHSSNLLLAMAKLNVYICGFKRGTVQVCCPKHTLIHPTSKPRVTGMQPDTSLVRHRNFNLINRNCGIGLTDRISGGQNASPGEFPWLAILLYNVSGELQYLCGGSLITDMYVLTAAHCITPTINNPSMKLVGLRLGEYDLNSEEDCSLNNSTVQCPDASRDYALSEIVLHSGFKPQDRIQFKNDVALIRLRSRVHFSEYVQPVCLPVPGRLTTKNGILSGLQLTVAGWGMTEKSAYGLL
ncbi:serine protease easter-like isoform X2 [Cryptotermes secundus]|uniref:serine protease easter-like isoform X2 n=1 Tax=Cryptotermes secundus TaxID=105785 RepID=UPI001454D07F|nr:serine protease easter-like isoform X2 [Cryptotermes secundus]